MDWRDGLIGWQQCSTGAFFEAEYNHDINRAVCGYQMSSFTTLVYRIDSGECLSVPSLSSDVQFYISLTPYNISPFFTT